MNEKITKSSQLPFISIIIPALNEERNISKCLLGIKKINYPAKKIEVVVVDNGSNDLTVEIASKYGVNVYEVENVTVGELRNFGAQCSKGEYLAFLDADCIPAEDWLLKSLEVFNKYPNVVVVGGVISLPESNSIPWVELYWVNYLNSKFNNEINFVETLASFCFLIRKDTFDLVNGFNVSLSTCEDYDLGYRLHELGKIAIVLTIKVIHLGNSKSLSDFWRRQIWQGRSNFRNLLSHKFSYKEIPSIILPILYIFAWVGLLIICLIDFNGRWALTSLIILFLFILPALVTMRLNVATQTAVFVRYWVIWCFYLTARGIGMIFPRIK